jgi:hypothetical protein
MVMSGEKQEKALRKNFIQEKFFMNLPGIESEKSW